MSDMMPPSTNLQAYQQIYANPNTFNDLKNTARKDQQAALKPVAEQFEAMFLSQILKESGKVKFDDGWLDGKQTDFYKDWYNQQLSQNISSQGSLGLADMIVKQLSSQELAAQPTPLNAKLPQQEGLAGARNTATSVDPSLKTTADNLASRPL